MTDKYPEMAVAVYQMCSGYDQYMPKLSHDVALAWATAFRHYRLTFEDLAAAVHQLYRENGNTRGYPFRVQVADICSAARSIREDRLSRGSLADLNAHYEQVAQRIAPKVIEPAKAICAGPTARQISRPQINPLRVACPHCHAALGRPCTSGGVDMRSNFHPSRLKAIAAVQQP